MEVEHSELLQFLLLFAFIIAAAKAAGWASQRLGQPTVAGKILAGVLLGPSLLNVLEWGVFQGGNLDVVLANFANLGVIFLMFIAGLETDLDEIRRVRGAALAAGTAGVFAPLLLGVAVTLAFGYTRTQAIFAGIVLAATSVSITVHTLIELGQLESREGVTLLAAAVIDDVIAIVVLSLFVAVSGRQETGLLELGLDILQMAAFFFVAIVGGARVMKQALRRSRTLPVSEGLLAFTIVAIFVYAWAAEAFGQVASITGAYIVGVLVAQAGFRENIERRLRAFTYAILVPVFFISIGLQTNARLLHLEDIPFTLLIVVAAVVGKVIGSGGGALIGGFAPQPALRVGVGMVSRGEVGLIIAAIGVQAGLLTERIFAVMVIMVMATTILTPPLLKLTFPRRDLSEAEAVTQIMGQEDGEGG